MGDVTKLTILFMKDPLYNPAYNLVMDFRDSLAIGFGVDLMDYVDFFKRNVKLPQKIQVGIMVNTPNQEFLVSLYKPIAALMRMNVEKFKSENECLIWLSLSTEEIKLFKENLQSLKAKPI